MRLISYILLTLALIAGKPGTVSSQEDTSSKSFVKVDEMPQYPGGEQARLKFIREVVVYPDSARNSHIEGTVYAQFTVTETGLLTDIVVLRGLGYGCDEEVIKMIQKMPPWIPGKVKGMPVNIRMMMPVTFTYTKSE